MGQHDPFMVPGFMDSNWQRGGHIALPDHLSTSLHGSLNHSCVVLARLIEMARETMPARELVEVALLEER